MKDKLGKLLAARDLVKAAEELLAEARELEARVAKLEAQPAPGGPARLDAKASAAGVPLVNGHLHAALEDLIRRSSPAEIHTALEDILARDDHQPVR